MTPAVPKSASNRGLTIGRIAITFCLVALIAGAVGQLLPPLSLAAISALLLVAITFTPNKVLRPRVQMALLGWTCIGIIVTIASCTGHLSTTARQQDEARARDSQRQHERRLAWQRAHPAEMAKLRESKRRAAARRDAELRRQQIEYSRIVSIPFATRLENANAAFNRELGDEHMFVNAVVLHTYVSNGLEVIMVDQTAWRALSVAERDSYKNIIESRWDVACVRNFACDENDVHSRDGRRNLNWSFTSYFDHH